MDYNHKMCTSHMPNDICASVRVGIQKGVSGNIYEFKEKLKKGLLTKKTLPFRYIYSHKILIGLIFSCCGDALLNLDLFAFGMVMFAVAQVFYTSAFGFKPLKLWIGLILYIFGAIGNFCPTISSFEINSIIYLFSNSILV